MGLGEKAEHASPSPLLRAVSTHLFQVLSSTFRSLKFLRNKGHLASLRSVTLIDPHQKLACKIFSTSFVSGAA